MPESNEGILRQLCKQDVPAAFQLSAQAGWNQTEDDWQTLLDLAPKTCFGIEISGELASTTTLICYGRRLGWVGMVLTKSEFRKQGLARKLLQHTLTVADRMGIETLKLDATDQGEPLYIKCGFHGEHVIERWSRSGPSAETVESSPLQASSWSWCEEDLKYFGADRLPLLERLTNKNPPLLRNRAYLLARPGRVCAYLGPCVSDDPGDARALISTCLEQNRGNCFWDLFPDNRNAVSIARELRFTPQRHLLRMARGKVLSPNIDATYAIAGFELG